ncbi:MAG TPA: response regulator transcription factor, partial [Chitinophagaceae bacterium]|nr:response regulator transcription factor [Chitinophagaceae bacterium]
EDSHRLLLSRLLDLPTFGLLHKCAAAEEYSQALEAVRYGKVFYCRETLQCILPRFHQPARRHTDHSARFTRREKEIIHLICEECTAKEIADRLSLSKRTVENRKNRILEKMQAKNIAGMVAYAYRHNLVGEEVAEFGN